jgi:hypothetical protein
VERNWRNKMLTIGKLYLYRKTQYSRARLVLITDGCYTDPIYGRISNFWDFTYITKNGFLGKKGHDYNNESWKFKPCRGYRIETRIVREEINNAI